MEIHQDNRLPLLLRNIRQHLPDFSLGFLLKQDVLRGIAVDHLIEKTSVPHDAAAGLPLIIHISVMGNPK